MHQPQHWLWLLLDGILIQNHNLLENFVELFCHMFSYFCSKSYL